MTQFTVHVAADHGVGAVAFIRADKIRPHRAKGVKRLAHVPLLVAVLPVACGDVVDDGVAPYVGHRVLGSNAFAALANDDGQLGLVVNGGRDVGRWQVNRGAGADHRLGHFGKDDRVSRNITA